MSQGGRSVGRFVRRRRAGWERLELLAGRGRLSLGEVEELDRLYRRAAGDLAYARTAFPGTDVEGYLGQVTARAYALLHRRRLPPGRRARQLVVEIPAVFRANLPLFGLAALLLLSGMAAGALAVAFDPAAAALVPPEVRAAVEARRMWTDSLLGLAPGAAGSALARHNITVSALVLAGGLTGGLLTGWLLFANGLLLGAVAVHCAREEMLGPFVSFVAAHAPAELLAVLLAGQGGFALARALLAPGEAPRGQALAAAGREAGRLLWLVVVLLLLVGLVESTISPGRLFPLGARLALGLSLAGAVLLYLAWPGRARTAAPAATAAGS